MVLKFLKGKKSEYFLEAPPSTNGAESDTTPAPLKAVSEALAPTKEILSSNGAAEATKAKTKTIKKSKSAEAKSAEAKSTEAKESAPAAPSPVVAKPVASPQPEPVTNFATDHLMPLNMPRRRPGPSLDTFRNMAKDVTPRK